MRIEYQDSPFPTDTCYLRLLIDRESLLDAIRQNKIEDLVRRGIESELKLHPFFDLYVVHVSRSVCHAIADALVEGIEKYGDLVIIFDKGRFDAYHRKPHPTGFFSGKQISTEEYDAKDAEFEKQWTAYRRDEHDRRNFIRWSK